ncbi:MAG TPA: CsiV family protein [Gammaproteobacteria bacterium]|nr:CsiV family protein [Gammaproteobacteria bacterium]
MRGILAFVAASLACASGVEAQAPQPPEPAIPPRYEVEVIVFAHRDFDGTEERFDQSPAGFLDGPVAALREAPEFDESTFAPRGAAQAPFEPLAEVDPTAAAQAEALRVRPLRPEELKLGQEYRKLRAISAYEPLVHVGWVQPGLPEADAVPMDLGTLGVLNPRGTVRVHLSRFLHITLDLTYQSEGSATPAAATARDGGSAANAASTLPPAGDGLDEIVLAPHYRLATTRSARSNELHYFDHPAFGVLVRVTPVPAPDASGRRPAA